MPQHPLSLLIDSSNIGFTVVSPNPSHPLLYRDRNNTVALTVSRIYAHLIPNLVKLRDIPPGMIVNLSHHGQTLYPTHAVESPI